MHGPLLNSTLKKTVIIIVLVGIMLTAIVHAASTSSVSILFVGSIANNRVNGVTASSGSPSDLQSAIDTVARAGGGTVYVPAGNFTFNPPPGGIGVTVPAGVNLVGAGKDRTFLIETVESKESVMMKADGTSQAYNTPNLQAVQKPIVIVGISFMGFVPRRIDADTTTNNVGVNVNCVKDFVLYGCRFSNFVNSGVVTENNMGWEVSPYLMRGVISHCVFDQPYKNDLNVDGRIWGYGVIVGGTGYWAGTPAVSELLGRYGQNTVFIENCDFRRCRHSIASSQASYYVARYNYFTDMVQCFYGSFIDAHGSSKGFEIYSNTIVDVPADVRITSMLSPISDYLGDYMGRGINPRGGRGVIFNNTLINLGTYGIGLTNDGGSITDAPLSETRTQDVFIWGNTFQNVPTQIDDDGSVVLNSDYFLRQPTMAQDGFTYTPYQYPHPLVSSAAALEQS